MHVTLLLYHSDFTKMKITLWSCLRNFLLNNLKLGRVLFWFNK